MASDSKFWTNAGHVLGVMAFFLSLVNLAINYWMYERTWEATEIARKAEDREQLIFDRDSKAKAEEARLARVVDDASVASLASPFRREKEVRLTVLNASKDSHITTAAVSVENLCLHRGDDPISPAKHKAVDATSFPGFFLNAGSTRQLKFKVHAQDEPAKDARITVRINGDIFDSIRFEYDDEAKEYRRREGWRPRGFAE